MLRCEEILKATGGELLSGDINAEISNVSTDSRKISPGDIFIPIEGERFDGHDFIKSAFELGATAAITHRDAEPVKDGVLIRVGNTLKALGDIAGYYRSKFNIPIVGITGSVGKTSTKDMVACVLGRRFKVLKTEGNFNNEIGLPLTVFNLDSSHEAAVVEMGMSGFGEISRLTSIARPDIVIITNIGVSHIEKLGSRQNILKAKMEILGGLSDRGLVVLNGDDKLLYGTRDYLSHRAVFFGMEEGMDYQAYNVKGAGENGTYFEIALGNKEYLVHVPAPGIHNVYNALAAFAVGVELNIPAEMIIEGIAEFIPGKMRMNIISQNGIKIINDTYNASPQSMEAAINVLKDIGGNNRTIAILGDMLEMGEWAAQAHVDIGRYAVSKGIDYIITAGQSGKYIARGALNSGMPDEKIFSFDTNSEVKEFVSGFVRQGDIVLVKGSRGMKMEKIVDRLLETT